MNCKHCGAFLPEGTRFCTSCGAEVVDEAVQPRYEQQYESYEAPAYSQPASSETSKSVLTWGILGLAFGVSFLLSILGIIFSAIAKSKAKNYLAANGVLDGKARTGNGLATGGLIAGIIFTVFFIIWVIAIAGAASYGYYYY